MTQAASGSGQAFDAELEVTMGAGGEVHLAVLEARVVDAQAAVDRIPELEAKVAQAAEHARAYTVDAHAELERATAERDEAKAAWEAHLGQTSDEGA